MNTYTLPASSPSPSARVPDELLWQDVRRGNTDAFSRVVERYQSLVCAVAYAGVGDLAYSQDIAQETFVAAWTQRDQLAEPERLRGWLCGIARTMAAGARRRTARRGGPAESLENVQEPESAGIDPLSQAVSREEEQLLWRAIESLPPTYREPVILFYREDHSIVEVARQLSLTEDTVKQRLSRGRAMLRAEVTTMVESVLGRSRPTSTFTAGVLAAIAMATPATATAAVTAAAVTTKTAAGGGLSVVAGPAAGLAIAWVMSRLLKMNARSPQEAAVIGRVFAQGVGFAVGMVAILLGVGFGFGWERLAEQPAVLAGGIIAWTGLLLTGLMWTGRRAERAIGTVRISTATTGEASLAYRSKWQWLGLPLFAYSSSGLDIGGGSRGWVKGWIAVGDLAISPLIAIGGLAIAPIAIGGATVGIVSASLLGIGVGVLALGSIAIGWWSIGFVAVGWRGAGIVTVANELVSAPLVLAALVPVIIIASIVIPAGILVRRAWLRRRTGGKPPAPSTGPMDGRIHGIDSLRAVALLLGLVLHSSLPYVVPPGIWAVGTTAPQPFLGWLVHYIHSFRMEAFFLIAGFLSAMVIGRRGIGAWLRDRGRRVLLVFLVALFPMKVLLAAVWIWAGRADGWLPLPAEIASLPVWMLAVGSPTQEQWPDIRITHLWFLYYLSIVSGLAALGWFAARKSATLSAAFATVGRIGSTLLSHSGAPVWIGLVITPVVASMTGFDIDTPDSSFAWHWPVIFLYGIWFALGWALNLHRDALSTLATRWKVLLPAGLFLSFVTVLGSVTRMQPGPWATANADLLRWITSFGLGVSMTASVLGWLGLFLHFNRPSAVMSYLSGASYWIYVAHLPVMTALQVWWRHSGLPWFVQIPLINVATMVPLLALYELYRRRRQRQTSSRPNASR